jgi:hypothetical protein
LRFKVDLRVLLVARFVGPRGTTKMLVDGAGQIKLTKVTLEWYGSELDLNIHSSITHRTAKFFCLKCRSKYDSPTFTKTS